MGIRRDQEPLAATALMEIAFFFFFPQRKITLALDTWPRKGWFGGKEGKFGIVSCGGIGNEAGRNTRGHKGRKSRNCFGKKSRIESKPCPIPTRALSATSRNSLDASRDGDPSHSNA